MKLHVFIYSKRMAVTLYSCEFICLFTIIGSKVVHAKASATRELVTVVACGNAAKTFLSPHVIIPGKTKRALNSYDVQNAFHVTYISVF